MAWDFPISLLWVSAICNTIMSVLKIYKYCVYFLPNMDVMFLILKVSHQSTGQNLVSFQNHTAKTVQVASLMGCISPSTSLVIKVCSCIWIWKLIEHQNTTQRLIIRQAPEIQYSSIDLLLYHWKCVLALVWIAKGTLWQSLSTF